MTKTVEGSMHVKNAQVAKLFLILFICTAYFFCFTHFGVKAYESFFKQNNVFTEGTRVASLSIAEKTPNEAIQLVDEHLTKWLNETTVTFQYKEKSSSFDLTNLIFDVEATVTQAKNGEENLVDVGIVEIGNAITSISKTLTKEQFQMEKLEADILSHARMLEIGNFSFRLEDYILDSSLNDPKVINQATISVDGTTAFFDKPIEIEPKTEFSFLQYLQEQSMDGMSSNLQNKIATAIYEVILPSNFQIIERHISNELPKYSTLGLEAKVDDILNQNLVFYNPNDLSYFIEFKKSEKAINVSLTGPTFLNQYLVSFQDKESFKPKIIREFNPLLKPTEIKVKKEGKEGQLVKVYRTYHDEDGNLIQKEFVSEDFYPPIHRVEVQGLIVVEENTVMSSTESSIEAGTPSIQDSDSQDSTPANFSPDLTDSEENHGEEVLGDNGIQPE